MLIIRSEENHCNKVLSLSYWLHGGKDDGITTLVKTILDGSTLGSFCRGGGDFLEEKETDNTNIKQCLRKVADGHFTAAVKVLSSSDVAPYRDDTIKALEAKHPYRPLPSMPSITFSEPPLVAEIDSVFGCIKSFPKDTSYERDEFVAYAPLTPLLKPNNGIRPIAVGTIWRRLVSKVARVLNIIKVSGLGLSLELNIKKTKIFWPSCNGMKLREGLFPVDIWRLSSSVKLIRGAVSRDIYFINGLAMRRAANAVDLMIFFYSYMTHRVSLARTMLQSFLGLYILNREKRSCKESKDLSSLALDELIGNLKVHEVVKEKDSKIYRGKKERVKSIFLKPKKESSNETLTSGCDDEQYAIAVRNFKKFFGRKGKFVRQPREEKKSF
nr:putative reverse transcriptase domain-containing protein [Tanacetum cinerariifolium]